MTDDSPSLLRLPDVTMNHILYFCDYLDIARLRKVCHSLRTHIDVNKPDAHVKDVSMGNLENTDIIFESDNNFSLWIEYKKRKGRCAVDCVPHRASRPKKTISGMNPMDVLIQDFKIYMRHLKTPLRQFQLYEICFDALLQIKREQPPESRIFPLNVDKLEMYRLSPDQILAVLPLFDANHLKDLRIDETEGDGLNEDDFHAFFETEHWRKAEKIWLLSNLNILNVRQISHLKEFHGSISRITAADAVFLKNTFISSPVFERCCIRVDVDLNSLPLQDIFGPSFFDRITNSNRWYFHIPNDTNSALRVDVSSSNEFEIARINRRYVVPGAVIIY